MRPTPIAQKLLLRNRRVRVWEMVLEPGEAYPRHRHHRPYLSICLEPALLELTDGRGRARRLRLREGDLVWERPPEVHSVRNLGRTRFRNRLVEILG